MGSLKKKSLIGLGLATLLPVTQALAGNTSSFVNHPPRLTYDNMGMPYVLAADEAGGYHKLCYAMAKDRLFQMDISRRAAYGKLAEIFGAGPNNSLLQQDMILRVHNIADYADQRLNDANLQTRNILSACTTGVNQYIKEAAQSNSLPLEFSILQYTPSPWAEKDSVAIIIYLAAGFSNIGTQVKLNRAILGSIFGPVITNTLIPNIPETYTMFDANGNYVEPPSNLLNPPGQSTSMPIDFGRFGNVSNVNLAGVFPKNAMASQLQASNAFVVDGSLTTSGKPILANDPHLQLTTPSSFYFAQLQINPSLNECTIRKLCPSTRFNVRGEMIAGVPSFFGGQTEFMSWGGTVAGIDDTDLYMETITLINGEEYVLINGRSIPVLVKNETINVAGQAPVAMKVRTTPHGTILNDAIPSLDAFGPIAMKATFMQSAWKIDGLMAFPQVQNWTQFQSAIDEVGFGLNYVYSDNAGTQGNIGYRLSGLMPQRHPENLYVPVSGSDGQHEWAGYATSAQHPRVLNPSNHFLVSANNRTLPSNYAPGGIPVTVGNFLEQPWRMLRASKLLYQAGNNLQTTDLGQIQLDTYNATGKDMATIYVTALQNAGLPANDPDAANSLTALQTWDGKVDASSKGALIYEALTALLVQDTAQNVIGPQLYQNYAQGVFTTLRVGALQGMLANPQAPFFGIQPGDNATAKRNAAIQTALAKADQLLRDTLGTNTANWSWGQLHTLTYNHPLAQAPIPSNPFASATYPTSGDFATLNIGWWGTKAALLALPPQELTAAGGPLAVFAQDALASIRVMWDQSSFYSSIGVSSTGQSGNPFSPFWMDQAARWRFGTFSPLSYNGAY